MVVGKVIADDAPAEITGKALTVPLSRDAIDKPRFPGKLIARQLVLLRHDHSLD
jgi:hypothetical protein